MRYVPLWAVSVTRSQGEGGQVFGRSEGVGGGVFLLQETRDDPRLSPAQDKQGLIC